ncbi:chromosome condensation complex protein [Dorcoceras hygrometricum]|uniref:Chromosome condensation complex protein n=1 Tax=Dorcoceras hygrometricum TaxID=472368 RepID=A0A2Z7ADD0_9LAMI|nr:chromosome condensation complex protein [Dorcoceras hygrometricum]
MASQIFDILPTAHSKSLEELQAQQQEHGIIMDRPRSSQFFKDFDDINGSVLAQFYSLAKSIIWVRPMILVDGIWTPLQGNDYWRSSCRLSIFVNRKRFLERIIEENFVLHGYFIEPVQYWGAAPSIIKSWGWFRVCLDIFRYSMFGCLHPVRDENFCREIVAISSVEEVVEKLPSNLCSVIHQGQATKIFVGYFSDSVVHQGLNSTPDMDSVSSDCSTVYHSPSPQHDSFLLSKWRRQNQVYIENRLQCQAETEPSVHRESSSVSSVLVSDPNAQVDMVQRPDSQIPTVDSPMRFNSDDLSLDDTADNKFSLPAVTTELSASPDALRTFLSQRLDTQTKDIRQIDDSQNDVLSKLNTLEKGLHDTLRQLEETFRNLIQSARQDGRTLDDVQTLRFNEFRKVVLAHSASVTADLMDVWKEVKGLNAKVTYLDEQGEGSSSRPQPPPDDHDRPTGEGSANREAGIGGDGRNRGGSGSSGSQSRGNRSGSTNKMGSGGESPVRGVRYGPYPPTGVPKRSVKH